MSTMLLLREGEKGIENCFFGGGGVVRKLGRCAYQSLVLLIPRLYKVGHIASLSDVQ